MPRPARSAKPSAKKATIAVDFSDTESSGVIPEIDVLLECDETEVKTSDNSGSDYIALTFKVQQPEEFAGRKLYHNCSLQPQALFNLRGVLEAMGFEVPQGVMELDPADLVGEVCGGSITHEEYQGKTKARLTEFFTADEFNAEPEADPPAPAPAPAPASTKVVKKAAAPAPTAAPAPAPTAAPAAAKKVVRKKGAAPTMDVGISVTFTDDEGNEQSGEVTKLEGTTATVTVGEDEWELETAELTIVT